MAGEYSNLIIKISGETKQFEEAVGDIKGQTEALEGQLNAVGKASGIAFAGLIASAGIAVHAFAESEKSSKQLILSLQNQGIASNELKAKYDALASSLSKKTGIDDDAITSGQAILQNFLGQTEITEGLAEAMVNLGAKTGDLSGAAEILGRAAAGNVRGLKQFGISIDESLSKEERLVAIQEQVNQKFGGFAESTNSGLGGIQGLQTAIGNFTESIGKRLAPTVSALIKSFTEFFNKLNDNEPLLDFIFEVGKIALIVTGVITALAGVGVAALKMQQAFLVAKAAVTAFGLASKVAIGATGIGLLLIVAGEIYANWNTIWPVMTAVFQTFATNITKIGGALGHLLAGIFTFNINEIKTGLEQAKAVLIEGLDNIKKSVPKEEVEIGITQDPAKLAAANRAQEELLRKEQDRLALRKAQQELAVLQADDASKRLIQIKSEEVEILKKIGDDAYAGEVDSLREQLERKRQLEAEAQAEEALQNTVLQQQLLADNEEYQGMSEAQQEEYLKTRLATLGSSIQTYLTIRQAAADAELKIQIEANNKQLLEERKFGLLYAQINRVMYDEQVKGASQAFSQLTGLQQSSNATLKAIGKAAAVADITVKTAQAAMNIYAGFSTIPLIGPALGVAGAAAAIAFGAEQIGRVVGAQEGGRIEGGFPGRDSVPVMAEPGELIAPRQNFEEVVGSVQYTRAIAAGEASPGGAEIMISLKDDIMDFIELQLVRRQNLNISLQAT